MPDATDYILTLSGPSGVTSYRSWVDSAFLTNTSFRIDATLDVGVAYEWWVQGESVDSGALLLAVVLCIGRPGHLDHQRQPLGIRLPDGQRSADFGHTRA